MQTAAARKRDGTLRDGWLRRGLAAMVAADPQAIETGMPNHVHDGRNPTAFLPKKACPGMAELDFQTDASL